MRKLLLIVSVFLYVLSNAQEGKSKIEDVTSEIKNKQTTIPSEIVEQFPSHPDCVDIKDNREQRRCFNMKIIQHIRKHFKPNKKMYKFTKYVKDDKTGKTKVINSKLDKGHYRIKVKFNIGLKGVIEDIEVLESPTFKLADEAKRVVKLLPVMKPGTQQGKPIKVSYSSPINFVIN